MSRVGRLIKRLAGKKVTGPPHSTVGADSFPGDYVIGLLETSAFQWPPTVLIAVCEK